MGAKYTTNSATGYNSSPPADDGSQTAANLITWAKSKEKLGDPVKTLADDINTDLVAAFDYAVRQITTSDPLVAGDHMRTVEIAPTATTGVTVTLAAASSMTNIYRVFIKNSSPHEQTIAPTASDTVDGLNASFKIPSKAAFILTTNNAADGYLIAGSFPLEVARLTEETAPSESDLFPFYDLSATALKKVQLRRLTAFKVGSFTRDIATASGTQAVTGVGFAPKAVFFIAGQTGSGAYSHGFDDGTTAGSLGFTGPTAGTAASIFIDQGTSNTYSGVITTLGSDGFTITWTKANGPSGTYTINYLAFR